MKILKTSDVIYREDLYPRIKANPQIIQRYAENIEVLPPIEINQHNILIDGYHRWTAHRKVEAETIQAIVTETKSEAELYGLAIERNRLHGEPYNRNDSRKQAKKLFNDFKMTPKDIAIKLSLAAKYVKYELLNYELKKQRQERNDLIMYYRNIGDGNKGPFELTQDEIADLVNKKFGLALTRQTISNVIESLEASGIKNGRIIENKVNQELSAYKPNEDSGIDGITANNEGIQTTISYTVPKVKVHQLVQGMQTHGLKKGILVGKRITKGTQQQIDRYREQGYDIEFRPLSEVINGENENSILQKIQETENFAKFLSCDLDLQDFLSEQEIIELNYDIETNLDANFLDEQWTPPLYNVWRFSNINNKIAHFGHSEQTILENLLYLYTEPFDIVLDPFGGGGATIDVCQKRVRRYWISDRKPIVERENEIRQLDIGKELPPLHKRWSEVTLTYLDPPYWRQAQNQYSNDKEDLANMSLEDFTKSIIDIINNIASKQSKGVIAMLMQPTQWNADNREFTDHVFDIIQGVKLSIENRVSCPYSTEQANAQMVNWAKENKKLLVISRELVIWKLS